MRGGDPEAIRPRRRTGLLVLLTVLGFVMSGVGGAVAYFLPVITTALHDTGPLPGALPSPKASAGAHSSPGPTVQIKPLPTGKAGFTVLLLGSDNDPKFVAGHILTQSMILVRVIPATHQVSMLSIPRDLWVPLATGGTAKIDAAYAFGGPAGAIQTVEQDFHVHVDYYAWIGLQGLVGLINKIGGINIVAQMPVLDNYYPADLTGHNPFAYQRICVLPGPQRVPGARALVYARSRHGSLLGDIARNKRQQEVLVDIKAQAKTLGIADIPRIASSLSGEIHTDLGLGQVASLLPLARALGSGSVHQVVMLPPDYTPATIGSQQVLLPNWTAINGVVRQLFGAP